MDNNQLIQVAAQFIIFIILAYWGFSLIMAAKDWRMQSVASEECGKINMSLLKYDTENFGMSFGNISCVETKTISITEGKW